MPRARPGRVRRRERRASRGTPSSTDFSPHRSDGPSGSIAISPRRSRVCARISIRAIAIEDGCVATIAASYVRMAALWRYENIAAMKHHEECERELNARIASAEAAEAARLGAYREELRRAGLWQPTIPGPREACAIARYQGRLERAIREAIANLESLSGVRGGAVSHSKMQKQTQFIEENRGISNCEVLAKCDGARAGTTTRRARWSQDEERPARPPTSSAGLRGGGRDQRPEAAEGPQTATPGEAKSAKTNPLSSMFMGNRHQRRRARALARRET